MNKIGPKGATALSTALKSLTLLENLDLGFAPVPSLSAVLNPDPGYQVLPLLARPLCSGTQTLGE